MARIPRRAKLDMALRSESEKARRYPLIKLLPGDMHDLIGENLTCEEYRRMCVSLRSCTWERALQTHGFSLNADLDPNDVERVRGTCRLIAPNGTSHCVRFLVMCDERRRAILQALERPDSIETMKSHLRKDRNVALVAVARDAGIVPDLNADASIALVAVARRSEAFRHVHDDLKKDRDLALVACSRLIWPDLLAEVGLELRKDPYVVMAAASRNRRALQYAHPDLATKIKIENPGDEFVVLAAMLNGIFTDAMFKDALNGFRNRSFVLAAVTKNGGALKYASDKLRDDRTVVLVAVSRDGNALQYASGRLQDDRDVVIAAVSSSGDAIQYASSNLQHDRGIVMVARYPLS